MKHLFFFAFLTLLSCDNRKDCCSNYDLGIEIYVENSVGENLLLPSTPGAIDPELLRLYYDKKGTPVEVYSGNLTCPRNICVMDNNEALLVSMNDAEEAEFPLTYIRWSEADTDTIKCEIVRSNNGNNVYVKQFWYNGVLAVPDADLSGRRAVKVIK